jgi:hypothetical protein
VADGAPYDFDITDQVESLGRRDALLMEDKSYAADNLWFNWVSQHRELYHDGPFSVYCHDQIAAFFVAAG